MTPIIEDENMTSSGITKMKIKETYKLVSNFNDEELMKFKPDMFVEYKKPRNKMKHLTPKKKKRKK